MQDEPPAVAVLHRIATHVLARARYEETGRTSLRATPGGFGTPAFGPRSQRIRIAGSHLLVEHEDDDGAGTAWCPVVGSSIRQLADTAGVALDAAFRVGRDTVDLGDPDEPIEIDPGELVAVCGWYGAIADALDAVSTSLRASATAGTVARLWPEHFDLAIDVALDSGDRANLGGSPGDAHSAEPYVYVGPWSPARPGDPGFWNAPFGAVRTRSELGADPAGAAAEFLQRGVELLEEATPS